ncbi:hypothetical protein O181_048117 [Austropuccinia psidii MF-1]|uniref:Uncharacterized protein n=1 Tax=Austropuccinia psidii MF-1 TaxID=1389203 RepID=A0A9Q3DUH4_9BASI|nr:hypothetical protein [Austropuccinia psidii MF-1]
MEATIQSNQMDVDKEEASPTQKCQIILKKDTYGGCQSCPPFLKNTIELLEGWRPLSCKEKVKKINNWLKNQSLSSIDQKKELEMTPALETEGPVASTSSKPAPEVSKDRPKGPQKMQKGPKNHQGKGKGKANWQRPYPQRYRIPKLEPSAVDSVFNMSRALMKFTAKDQERMNRTFPCK